MKTIRKKNLEHKEKPLIRKEKLGIFIMSILLIIQRIFNSEMINFPNMIILLLAFLALIFCCYNERKLFKNLKHFAIGRFLVQYLVLFMFFSIGGLCTFGIINTLISKDNTIESDYCRILKVTRSTSITSPSIYISFRGQEFYVKHKSSKIVSDLNLNSSLCDKYSLYLESLVSH